MVIIVTEKIRVRRESSEHILNKSVQDDRSPGDVGEMPTPVDIVTRCGVFRNHLSSTLQFYRQQQRKRRWASSTLNVCKCNHEEENRALIRWHAYKSSISVISFLDHSHAQWHNFHSFPELHFVNISPSFAHQDKRKHKEATYPHRWILIQFSPGTGWDLIKHSAALTNSVLQVSCWQMSIMKQILSTTMRMFWEPESHKYLELETQSPSVPPLILWMRTVRPGWIECPLKVQLGRGPATTRTQGLPLCSSCWNILFTWGM